MNGRLDLVGILFAAGADIAVIDKVYHCCVSPNDCLPCGLQDGRTPISVAAANGHLDIVVWLAGHGAAINTADEVRAGAVCLCLL